MILYSRNKQMKIYDYKLALLFLKMIQNNLKSNL